MRNAGHAKPFFFLLGQEELAGMTGDVQGGGGWFLEVGRSPGGHSGIVGGTASIVQGAKATSNLVHSSTSSSLCAHFNIFYIVYFRERAAWKNYRTLFGVFSLLFVNHDSYIEYLSPRMSAIKIVNH